MAVNRLSDVFSELDYFAGFGQRHHRFGVFLGKDALPTVEERFGFAGFAVNLRGELRLWIWFFAWFDSIPFSLILWFITYKQ